MLGVDYSGSHPDPAGLAAAGYRFACRYLSGGFSGKQVTASEIAALHAHGIAVVANWETTADRALSGFNAGQNDAMVAARTMRSLGFPNDRPIYFSVDFDVADRQMAAVGDYFRGVAAILPIERIGVYGGQAVCEYLSRYGRADWFWQTYAWSHQVWNVGNHIEQYHNGAAVAGGVVDLNRSMRPDFGGWLPVTTDDLTPAALAAITDHVLNQSLVRVNHHTGHTDYTLATALERAILLAEQNGASVSDVGAEIAALPTGPTGPAVDVNALAGAIVSNQAFPVALGQALQLAGVKANDPATIADVVAGLFGARLSRPIAPVPPPAGQ